MDTTQTINFSFWTAEENLLVQSKKKFALAINFSDAEDVETSLYEWDPILSDVLDLSSELIHTGAGYGLHELVKFDVGKQFVVVRRNCSYIVEFMGQYDNKEEAIDTIKVDQLTFSSGDEDDDYKYVIVNLEHTTPYFFSKGKLIKRKHTNAGLFYYGTVSEPIKF